MDEDPENLDELLDALPGRLRRKVAKHLNAPESGEDAGEGVRLKFAGVRPPPPPPPLDKSYDPPTVVREHLPKRRGSSP